MTKLTSSTSSGAFLAQLLDRPQLMAQVRRLDGERLAGLIRHIGVDDAGELLALVSSKQLVELFDGELWRNDGAEEHLDPARFARWLEVLLESGAAFAAKRMAALPEELFTHALGGHLMVLDLDALSTAAEMDGVDDATDKALSGPLSIEIDQYLLLSRGHDGWDALVEVVLALDQSHEERLRSTLDRLCAATMEAVDESGLFTVLSEAEALAEDAVAEREERRAARGYVSTSDARAFLALDDDREVLVATPERDAITKAYFRRLKPSQPVRAVPSDLAARLDELDLAPALPEPNTQRLGEALRALHESDPTKHAERLEELAYLTNLLVAVAPNDERPRPADAAHRAMAACGRALAWLEARTDPPEEPVAVYPLDVLYRIGADLDG